MWKVDATTVFTSQLLWRLNEIKVLRSVPGLEWMLNKSSYYYYFLTLPCIAFLEEKLALNTPLYHSCSLNTYSILGGNRKQAKSSFFKEQNQIQCILTSRSKGKRLPYHYMSVTRGSMIHQKEQGLCSQRIQVRPSSATVTRNRSKPVFWSVRGAVIPSLPPSEGCWEIKREDVCGRTMQNADKCPWWQVSLYDPQGPWWCCRPKTP